MDGLKRFDRELLEKQIGGNSLIVIVDVIYLITGVFFGSMKLQDLYGFILFCNLFTTCILFHNFIVSRGDVKFELITEKIVYFPTTRARFLWNKYMKTLIFLVIQEVLTLACMGLGYYGNRGYIEGSRIIGGLILVLVGILFASGSAILVMHTMTFGIYLSMLLYFPLTLLFGNFEKILEGRLYIIGGTISSVLIIILSLLVIWMVFFVVGKRIYEKIS